LIILRKTLYVMELIQNVVFFKIILPQCIF
jgi:hypothetical protein